MKPNRNKPIRERVDRSTKIVLPVKTGKKCHIPADTGRTFDHSIDRGTYK